MQNFGNKGLSIKFVWCDPTYKNRYVCKLSGVAEPDGDHIATIDFGATRCCASWALLDAYGNSTGLDGVYSFLFTELNESYMLTCVLSDAYAASYEEKQTPLPSMRYGVVAIYAPVWAYGEGEIQPTPDVDETECGVPVLLDIRGTCCACPTIVGRSVYVHVGECNADATALELIMDEETVDTEECTREPTGEQRTITLTKYTNVTTQKLYARRRCSDQPSALVATPPYWYGTIGHEGTITKIIKRVGEVVTECDATIVPACGSSTYTVGYVIQGSAPAAVTPTVDCSELASTETAKINVSSASVVGTASYEHAKIVSGSPHPYAGYIVMEGCGFPGEPGTLGYRSAFTMEIGQCGNPIGTVVSNNAELGEVDTWSSASVSPGTGGFPIDWYNMEFDTTVSGSHNNSKSWTSGDNSISVSYTSSLTIRVRKFAGTNDVEYRRISSTAGLSSSIGHMTPNIYPDQPRPGERFYGPLQNLGCGVFIKFVGDPGYHQAMAPSAKVSHTIGGGFAFEFTAPR